MPPEHQGRQSRTMTSSKISSSTPAATPIKAAAPSPTSVIPDHANSDHLDRNLREIVELVSKLQSSCSDENTGDLSNSTGKAALFQVDYLRELRKLLHERIDEPVTEYDYSHIHEAIRQVTQSQSHNVLVQQEGCRARYFLRYLDGSNPLTKSMERLVSARAELAAMEAFPDDEVIQEDALFVLQDYAASSFDTHSVMCSGLDPILTALQKYSDNVNILQAGLVVLCNIAGTSSLELTGISRAIPGVVLELMRTHQDTPIVQVNACKTLSNLTLNNPTNQQILVHQGSGLQVLAETMQRFYNYVEIQESAMEVLLNLTPVVKTTAKSCYYTNLEGQEEILNAVSTAMKAHLQAPLVQSLACRVLVDWSLLFHNQWQETAKQRNEKDDQESKGRPEEDKPTEEEEEKEAEPPMEPLENQLLETVEHPNEQATTDESLAVVRDLIRTLLKVMRLHAQEYEIQFYAIQILRNLARRHHSFITPAGAMGTILVAMRDYEHHYDLQEHACAALYGLLSEGSLDDSLSLASECGISTLIYTIKNAQAHLDVQHFGLGALACLSTTRAVNNQELIVLAGGVQVIVNIMTTHPEHPEISQYGSEILKNLSHSVEYQSAIAASGGISAILTAMRRHGEYVGIQEFGCCTIRNFSLDAENQQWIASKGGISIMLVAMTLYPRHSEIQALGCEVIAHLAEDRQNQLIFASEHGIEEVCHIIREHKKDTEVRERGYSLLAQMVEARPELFALMEIGIQRMVSFRITKKETRKYLASMFDWFVIKSVAASRASMLALAESGAGGDGVQLLLQQDGGDDVETNSRRGRPLDTMSMLESETGWSTDDDDSSSGHPMTDTDPSENEDNDDFDSEEKDQDNDALLASIDEEQELVEEAVQSRSSVSRLVSWIRDKRTSDPPPEEEEEEDGAKTSNVTQAQDLEKVGLLSSVDVHQNVEEGSNEEPPTAAEGTKEESTTATDATASGSRRSLFSWFRGSSSGSSKGSDADADSTGKGDSNEESSSSLPSQSELEDPSAAIVGTTAEIIDEYEEEEPLSVDGADDCPSKILGSPSAKGGPVSDSDSTGDILVFEENEDDDDVASRGSTEVNFHVYDGEEKENERAQ